MIKIMTINSLITLTWQYNKTGPFSLVIKYSSINWHNSVKSTYAIVSLLMTKNEKNE